MAGDAVIEIGPELAAAADHGWEIPIGGADQAKIRAVPRRAADPFVGAFLDHAQQLRLLHRQMEFTDLVKKQRAAMGQSECAALAFG